MDAIEPRKASFTGHGIICWTAICFELIGVLSKEKVSTGTFIKLKLTTGSGGKLAGLTSFSFDKYSLFNEFRFGLFFKAIFKSLLIARVPPLSSREQIISVINIKIIIIDLFIRSFHFTF